MRVKTTWFRQAGTARSPEATATVLASTVWKLGDKAVTDLSKADFDIITPERGFRIVGEMTAFLLHLSDRLLHGRVDDAQRAAMIQATGERLAEIMERNIRELVGEDGFDYRSNYLAMLDRRGDEYAGYEFPAGEPSYPALCHLAHAIREVMVDADKLWVIDQLVTLGSQEGIDTVKKTVEGLLNPQPSRRKKSAAGQ